MKGTSIVVILRSRSLESVRVAMIEGTQHPNPIRSGTMLLPERPIFRIARYHQQRRHVPCSAESSKMERKKNRVTIVGKKPITAPTPAPTPSMSNDSATGLSPHDSRPAAKVLRAILTPSLTKSEKRSTDRAKGHSENKRHDGEEAGDAGEAAS